ncbi:MAG: hypothetical protein HGA22_02530 [Clostridiales bacterium]|nr:hypothetical protein [Clostridiales bacterium]
MKLWQKNLLSMIIITVSGIILFYAAFLLAFLFSYIYGKLIMPITSQVDPAMTIHVSWHFFYFIFIIILSWLILSKKISDLVKAAYLSLPLMVVLVETGKLLYHWPFLVWSAGAVIIAGVIAFIYYNKFSWQYYFATLLAASSGALIMLAGIVI